jgi:hypothetical protein
MKPFCSLSVELNDSQWNHAVSEIVFYLSVTINTAVLCIQYLFKIQYNVRNIN